MTSRFEPVTRPPGPFSGSLTGPFSKHCWNLVKQMLLLFYYAVIFTLYADTTKTHQHGGGVDVFNPGTWDLYAFAK